MRGTGKLAILVCRYATSNQPRECLEVTLRSAILLFLIPQIRKELDRRRTMTSAMVVSKRKEF